MARPSSPALRLRSKTRKQTTNRSSAKFQRKDIVALRGERDEEGRSSSRSARPGAGRRSDAPASRTSRPAGARGGSRSTSSRTDSPRFEGSSEGRSSSRPRSTSRPSSRAGASEYGSESGRRSRTERHFDSDKRSSPARGARSERPSTGRSSDRSRSTERPSAGRRFSADSRFNTERVKPTRRPDTEEPRFRIETSSTPGRFDAEESRSERDPRRETRPSAGRRFSSDRPGYDRPRTERSGSDRPRTDRSSSDRPRTERSFSDRSFSDRPSSDRPRTDRSSSDRPSFDRPRTDRPSSDRPRSDRPSFDRSSSDRRSSSTGRSDVRTGGGMKRPTSARAAGRARWQAEHLAKESALEGFDARIESGSDTRTDSRSDTRNEFRSESRFGQRDDRPARFEARSERSSESRFGESDERGEGRERTERPERSPRFESRSGSDRGSSTRERGPSDTADAVSVGRSARTRYSGSPAGLGKATGRDAARSFDRDSARSFDRDAERPRDRDSARSFDRDAEGPRDRDSARSFDRDAERPRDRDTARSFDRDAERPRERDASSTSERRGTRSFDRDTTRSSDRDSARSSDRPSASTFDRPSTRPERSFSRAGDGDAAQTSDRPYRKASSPWSVERPQGKRLDRVAKSTGLPLRERRRTQRDAIAKIGEDDGEASAPMKRRVKSIPGKEVEQSDALRLNKFIADAGIASRRSADELIEAGVVKVNGMVVTEQGTKVHPSDLVTVKGEPVSYLKHLTYLVLNKPKDYITTTNDEKGRKTVMDLIPIKQRLYPVGRLDRNTTGTLIITNDGDLATRLMHPSHEIDREYVVGLDRRLMPEHAKAIANGVELEDGMSGPAEILINPDDRTELRIVLKEGRNREVRRLFEHFHYEVKRLHRVRYANISVTGMSRAEYRHLSREEVRKLRKLVGLDVD